MSTSYNDFSGLVAIGLEAYASKSVGQNPSVSDALSRRLSHAFAFGADDGQADMSWHGMGSITTEVPTYVIFNLRAQDDANDISTAFGDAIKFATVKAMLIENCNVWEGGGAASDVSLVVTCPGTNGFDAWLLATGDGVKIWPGGHLLITSPQGGWSVDDTHYILQLSHGGPMTSPVSYRIVIVGTSA